MSPRALSSGLDCRTVSKSNTLRIDACHAHMFFKRLSLGITGERVRPAAPPPQLRLYRRGVTTRGRGDCSSVSVNSVYFVGYSAHQRIAPSTLQYFKQKLAIKYTLVPIGLFCLRGERQ